MPTDVDDDQLDLAPIRQRSEDYRAAVQKMMEAADSRGSMSPLAAQHVALRVQETSIDSAKDVPQLVEEVERLRAEVHVLTNSEGLAVVAAEMERDRLAAIVDRVNDLADGTDYDTVHHMDIWRALGKEVD